MTPRAIVISLIGHAASLGFPLRKGNTAVGLYVVHFRELLPLRLARFVRKDVTFRLMACILSLFFFCEPLWALGLDLSPDGLLLEGRKEVPSWLRVSVSALRSKPWKRQVSWIGNTKAVASSFWCGRQDGIENAGGHRALFGLKSAY